MVIPTSYKLGFPKLKYPVVPVASGAPFQRSPTTSDLFDTNVGGYYQAATMWPDVANDTLWWFSNPVDGTTANWQQLANAPSSASSTAPTKGTFTLTAGTHALIPTTAAVTGAVIVYTVVTLGTVTAASSFLTTISNGVGFTPVASQATDTSVVNWAIVG